MNGKYKKNFKERLEDLNFRNINDVSFWKDQLNLKKNRKDHKDLWRVFSDEKELFADKSVVKCVEYIEENL